MPAKSAKHLPRKFLMVVDGSPEEANALRYVARRVQEIGGAIVLLLVLEPEGSQGGWLNITGLLREDAHKQAQRALRKHAKAIEKIARRKAEWFVREGETAEQILALIKEDKSISTLVLAAGEGGSPGPLITDLASGKLHCPIPITIVPAGLSAKQLDALT